MNYDREKERKNKVWIPLLLSFLLIALAGLAWLQTHRGVEVSPGAEAQAETASGTEVQPEPTVWQSLEEDTGTEAPAAEPEETVNEPVAETAAAPSVETADEPVSETAEEPPASAPARIVQIQAAGHQEFLSYEGYSLGLREDGTVAYAGALPEQSQKDLASWRNVSRLEINGWAYIIGYRDEAPPLLTASVDMEAYGFDGTRWMNWTQENFEGWDGVSSLVIEYNFIAGLRQDGTVLVKTGGLNDQINFEDFDQVADWRDIASLSSYDSSVLIGLKKDGTVVATNNYWLNYYWNAGKERDDDSEWNHINRIDTSGWALLAYRDDGSVLGISYLMGDNSWNNLTDIIQGSDSIFGLRRDGTVLTSPGGTADSRMKEVSGWQNIVQLSLSGLYRYLPIGLRGDGTVCAVYTYNGEPYGQWDVSGWTLVEKLFTGSGYTLGLRTDGRVLTTDGEFDTLEGLEEVRTWTDIVDIACTESHIVGLKKDGSVVAAGNNSCGECEVSGWTA